MSRLKGNTKGAHNYHCGRLKLNSFKDWLLLAGNGLHNTAGTQATGADVQGSNGAIGKLMTHALQVGVKTTLCFDVGMADQIANLRGFAAECTLFAHWISSLYVEKN